MNEEEKINKDRIANKIVKAIAKSLNEGFCEYFSYAWREKVNEMLEEESKYSRLVQWLNAEIEQKITVINVFCPADKNDGYQNKFFSTYVEQMKELAILIHFRELMLDERSTSKMRENIEYTVGKVFNVHYNDFLQCYI